MRPTRRAWGIAGTAALLGGLGALFGSQTLVVGGTVVAAFLLARLYLFVARFRDAAHALSATISVPERRVSERDDSLVTVEANLAAPAKVDLTVTAETPVSASGPPAAARRVRIPAGRRRAETTFSVRWSVAGTVAFEPPRVRVTDQNGLFETTVRIGSAPEILVEPRRPGRLHVGEGGERVGFGFGDHESDRLGSGIEPAELRRYTPGDDASDIDWNATARLDEAYVREHEAETDRRTVLVVDHRDRLNRGPPGETQLDYLRAVALTFVDQSREFSDPLGLYAVGDGGPTVSFEPWADPEQYLTVETALGDLEPTDPSETAGPASTRVRRGPGSARSAAAALSGDTSAFGRTLRPYFRRTQGYARRVADDPLYATADRHLRRTGDGAWVILFTDDSDPTRLVETVKLVRGAGADRVTVFLAPAVLFDPAGLADLERAYDRYTEFESLRRDLAGLDGVGAYEVGPGDRIDAVLSTANRRV